MQYLGILTNYIQTLLDEKFPFEKRYDICSRVMYNAILADGIKQKLFMTKMVFDNMVYPGTMITWNLGHEQWFMKEEFSRNKKLKRFTAPPVSPLVVALLSKFNNLVKVLLAANVKPDYIDFGGNRGENKDLNLQQSMSFSFYCSYEL